LRERAAHVRRVFAELLWEDDRRILLEYAAELEAQADSLEANQGEDA
jgi:sulfur transfer protein SufE